ncbi:unnamed protein product, partial [Didymodactylos carnosus]
ENSYIQHVEVDRQVCVLDVLDTAGQEKFSALGQQYMRKGHGFLLVYSAIDANSCKNIRSFYNEILRVKNRKSYPMILVANKVDLVHLRKVSEEEGRELAAELNIAYIETSAKDPPMNVDSAFQELVRIIRIGKNKKSSSPSVHHPRRQLVDGLSSPPVPHPRRQLNEDGTPSSQCGNTNHTPRGNDDNTLLADQNDK